MKAMIFAAGLGTRLKPLTNKKPKALVRIKGIPLLEIVIRRLIKFGFNEIIINVHHFAPLVIDFIRQNNSFGIKISISDETDQLLETGGGLKKAAGYFSDNQPFLLTNTDILSSMDLHNFYKEHCASNALATLAIRKRQTSRYLLFDQDKVMSGWANIKSGEIKLARKEADRLQMLAFSGIHVVHPAIFKHMPNKSAFSIIDVYLEAAKTEKIVGFLHDEDSWLDVGKHESLEKAALILDSY